MTKVTIELDAEYLNRICADLASELCHDMPNGHEIPDDDFAATLDAWREYSPRYVADTLARDKIAFTRGFAVRVSPRADIEARHGGLEESANLLATLVRQMPQIEAPLAR